MKEPRVQIWIDARGQLLNPHENAEVTYWIENLEQEETKKLLMEAIYPLVKEIILAKEPKNTVQIVYNPTYISATFLDYLLQQKGLCFKRKSH